MVHQILHKSGFKPISPSCKSQQGSKLNNDGKSNLVLKTVDSEIVLDWGIKTWFGWVAGAEFMSRKALGLTCQQNQRKHDM